MTRARYSEELCSNQKCGGDHQHVEERGHQPHDKPDEEAALVSHIGGRPVKKKTPSIRYPATEFDLSSNKASDRDVAPNPRDLSNNYEDGPQDASYEMARNRMENTPKLTDDEHKRISDTDNTRTKEDESFMKI